MKEKFWHKLSDEEFCEITTSGMCWDDIRERYEKPIWCINKNAIDNLDKDGCFNLKYKRTKICVEGCKNCKHYKLEHYYGK